MRNGGGLTQNWCHALPFPLHPTLRTETSLKIIKLGRKQNRGGKPLGWFPGFRHGCRSSHPLLGGDQLLGEGGALLAGFKTLGHPLPPTITSTGRRLLAHPHVASNNTQQSPLIRGTECFRTTRNLRQHRTTWNLRQHRTSHKLFLLYMHNYDKV